MNEIILHFDTTEHAISPDTLVTCLLETQNILRGVSSSFGKDDKDSNIWQFGTEHLRVHNPNWDQKDQKKSVWHGFKEGSDKVGFTVENEQFWSSVNNGTLHSETGEVKIHVQWIYQLAKTKLTKCKVLRVLEFNGIAISEPMTNEQVNAYIGSLDLLNEQK